MGRGSTELDNWEYDHWLSVNKKERELRRRHVERRNANKGFRGWHFGLSSRPIFAKDKDDFKRKLEQMGLMMRDDVKKELR